MLAKLLTIGQQAPTHHVRVSQVAGRRTNNPATNNDASSNGTIQSVSVGYHVLEGTLTTLSLLTSIFIESEQALGCHPYKHCYLPGASDNVFTVIRRSQLTHSSMYKTEAMNNRKI